MQPVTPPSRLLEAGSKSHLQVYHQVFVQKTGGYSRFKMNDEIAYFLFYFFTQRETGEEDCKPDWRSWETLSTWHTSTQDVRSCQSTTIFSMTVSPFCTESAHVWIAWRALCSSLLCSFHLLCLLSFRARLMLGFVCQPTRWGSHPGRWQRKGNSRQEPFLNMALPGVQRPTCVETSGDVGPGQNWKWRWKQSIGKPVHSLPHQPHVCTNTIWPQHLKMTVMNVNKGSVKLCVFCFFSDDSEYF